MSMKRKMEARQRKHRKSQEALDRFSDSDETFYYIAGYTSNGVPYGVTWEEMGLNPFEDEKFGEDDIEELPF